MEFGGEAERREGIDNRSLTRDRRLTGAVQGVKPSAWHFA